MSWPVTDMNYSNKHWSLNGTGTTMASNYIKNMILKKLLFVNLKTLARTQTYCIISRTTCQSWLYKHVQPAGRTMFSHCSIEQERQLPILSCRLWTKYFASWAQIGALKNLELMDSNDKYLNEDVPIFGNTSNMSTWSMSCNTSPIWISSRPRWTCKATFHFRGPCQYILRRLLYQPNT